MVKKTGELPKGKFDSRFVLPVYSFCHIGKSEFKKLEFFVGYKVLKVSFDTNNHRKAKVLVKVLTGPNKGFVYSDKVSRGFYNYYLSFDKCKTSVNFKNISDFTYLESTEKDHVVLNKEVDCKELSSIVYSQNQKVEADMSEERSKLMEKIATENKQKEEKRKIYDDLAKANDEIFK